MREVTARVRRLAEQLDKVDVDVAFIPPSRNFVYFTGLPVGHLGVRAPNDWLTGLLVSRRGETLLTGPKMHEEYLAGQPLGGKVKIWTESTEGRSFFADAVLELGRAPQRIGVDEDSRAKVVFCVRESLPECEIASIASVTRALRAVKDAHEVAMIREASRIQERVLELVSAGLKEGVSEAELAGEIDHECLRQGGEGPAFETIVRFGSHSAWLGPRPTREEIRGIGPLQIDLGVRFEEYCSDMTRTFHVGVAPEGFKRAYQAVLDAQGAALDAARPGAPAEEVDAAARGVLAAAGLSEYFPHRTGHGIGLEVGEEPNVAPGSRTVLTEGMVITVEPGVYLPSEYGIRIEDVVVVREQGPEFLTAFPRSLLEITYAGKR